MAELNRLFFALWPDDGVRNACAEATREVKLRAQPGGHLSAAERYHMTLLFLGDFVTAEQEALALKSAAQVKAEPFTLLLDYAGSFKNKQIPYWLGARNPPSALNGFYQALRETVTRAGVSLERMRFVPHLTILRDAQRPLADTPVKPISWEVKDFVLVRSNLNQRPISYDILGRWPLTGAPGSSSADQLKLF